jgi:nucleotide-binding universal stress UspA family protein
VAEKAGGATGGLVAYRSLLVPLDGSAEAEAALPHAAAHARAYGASITLIRVVSSVANPAVAIDLPAEAGLAASYGGGLDADPELMGASIYLEDVVGRLRQEGVEATSVVREGPIAPTILAEAVTAQADLIVLSTAVRSGIARLVLGNVADELLRAAPCPVLHVRAPHGGEAPASTRVRSFNDDLALAGPVAPVTIGLREVPVDRIVGSVGRARELGADFIPLNAKRREDERFSRLRKAMLDGAALPPIKLYKLGYNYYVLDGHHRVAVARAHGMRELEAEVTEFLSSSDAEQQQVFAERREFERVTGLTRVGAARPGAYPQLIEMIRAYAARAGDGDAGDLKDAARGWYYSFFQPMAQRIRARRLGQSFPGERTADILLRLRDFRAEEARLGHEVSWDAALGHFAAAYGRGRRSIWDLRRLVPLGRR